MKLVFEYDRDTAPEHLICSVHDVDASIVGKNAELQIQAHYDVVDSSGVNARRDAYSRTVHFESPDASIKIPMAELRAYPFDGTMIKVRLTARLEVEDGESIECPIEGRVFDGLDRRNRVKGDSQAIIEPADVFSLRKNIRAVPLANRIRFFVLAAVGAVVILVNSVVGLHDEMSPESQTYFYGKRDKDGDSKSPLINSLIGSGSIGMMVWLAMRRELRGYMKLELKSLPKVIDAATRIPIGDMIHGVSRVPLARATLRVVACNFECGQYTRGSGSKRRTVSFREPFNGVILYERRNLTIPAGKPLERFLTGDVEFRKLFASLYPANMYSTTHGIDLQWEVQLLHDDLVDQEIFGPTESFAYSSFCRPENSVRKPDGSGSSVGPDFFSE